MASRDGLGRCLTPTHLPSENAMPNATSHRLRLFAIAALFVVSLPAFATAQRTFVSSNGSDTGPCSITAPCRSFLAAIAQTNVNGEVIVQDSAGYGPVTITKSVSIIAPAGIYGGISVFSGNGITINGSNIMVVLRGLTINGQGGNFGIHFAQGTKLTIEDCEIANMEDDGNLATASGSTVTVTNTVMRDNGGGINVDGGVRATVANSVFANNASAGISIHGAGVTDVMVTRSTITGGNYGIYLQAYSPNTARAVSDGNAITDVSIAAFVFGGGDGTQTIYSPGNNTIGFNNAIVVGNGALTAIGMH
jgi:hypothetical protein